MDGGDLLMVDGCFWLSGLPLVSVWLVNFSLQVG